MTFSKFYKSHVRSIFFRIDFLGQIRNQHPKRHNNGWCGNWFAEKKWWSQPDLMTYRGFLGWRGMTRPPPHKKFYQVPSARYKCYYLKNKLPDVVKMTSLSSRWVYNRRYLTKKPQFQKTNKQNIYRKNAFLFFLYRSIIDPTLKWDNQ